MSKKKELKTNDLPSVVYRRSKFLHGLLSNSKAIIFNWSFYVSLFFSFLVFLYNHYCLKTNQKLVEMINSNRFDVFNVSVSAIGIIIAALAILVTIFKMNALHKIAMANKRTFESFIFPYRYSATLWGVLALSSLLSGLIGINMGTIINNIILYIWLFLLLYSTLYSLYLIQEILEYILYAAMKFGKDEVKKDNGDKTG